MDDMLSGKYYDGKIVGTVALTFCRFAIFTVFAMTNEWNSNFNMKILIVKQLVTFMQNNGMLLRSLFMRSRNGNGSVARRPSRQLRQWTAPYARRIAMTLPSNNRIDTATTLPSHRNSGRMPGMLGGNGISTTTARARQLHEHSDSTSTATALAKRRHDHDDGMVPSARQQHEHRNGGVARR